jgi:hypothetical protein
MGFELEGFLGKPSDLETWTEELPSAVICALDGGLALVPMTSDLQKALRAWAGAADSTKNACAWAKHASRRTTIAYFSAFEFGDRGSEQALAWSNGEETLSADSLDALLDYLRAAAGLETRVKGADLERQRGEQAAEKWAAAARAAKRAK